MVGFILASHGDFAEGIYSSAKMVFGEAEELQTVTFHNGETLDDLRGNLLKAVGKLSDQENVLFMVDLFAGSPYNQAFQLCAEHPGWAIITGLNLPMLAQAYGDRDTATAGEIATDLVGAAREGIVTHPEEFMPKDAAPAAASGGAAAGAIPPGTVLGDGHIKYVLARIDVDSGQRFSLVYDKIAAVLEPYLFIKSLFQFTLDIVVCEYVRLALIQLNLVPH